MSQPRWIGAFALSMTCFVALVGPRAAGDTLEDRVRTGAEAIKEKIIGWRRDIHRHPELGDQESRTASLVAEHLRGLGLEVGTGVARTGVVGVLRGASPVAPSPCAPTWTHCRSGSRRGYPSLPKLWQSTTEVWFH